MAGGCCEDNHGKSTGNAGIGDFFWKWADLLIGSMGCLFAPVVRFVFSRLFSSIITLYAVLWELYVPSHINQMLKYVKDNH